MSDKPVVLYACVHNSGRSVAARVLTEHYAQGAVEARSAGSEPKDAVNPVVAEVLADRGLSTAAERADQTRAGRRRGRRRRHHHGLRRDLPDLPGQALRGLARR